jgi:lipopolysaccharide/colanic/teichoic acid biosynthesis glycosyltransferase
MNFYRKFGKRALDLAIVVLGAPFWLPLMGVVALLVRIKLGSPVLFCQRRPGRGGQIFEIIKFRTMTDARDGQGTLLPDAQRLTAFGRGLRQVSLDELPELFNVLRGDMSLVGPRPLLIKYLPLYSREQARRHDTLPGITGWAQVKGRNAISWEDKFNFDVWYVDHISLGFDIKILLMTIGKVLGRKDVIEPGTGIHQEFTGSSPKEPIHPSADEKPAL